MHVSPHWIGVPHFSPGAAVALDQRRERPLAARLEHAGEQRFVAAAKVLDVPRTRDALIIDELIANSTQPPLRFRERICLFNVGSLEPVVCS